MFRITIIHYYWHCLGHKAVSLASYPGFFLVEERAWQHWGVGAVYFRYVTVHVIYSDRVLFLKIIMRFLRGHVVCIFKQFSKKTEKSSTVIRHQVNRINKTITQSQHEVRKQVSLQFTHVNF